MNSTIENRIEDSSREPLDELEDHVECCLGGRIQGFRILPQNGGLVLQGHTHTYHAKQLAQHVVMEKTKLPIVANDIEVA
jgi:hypothetical protein